jgi:hypothetical protein
LWQIVALYNDSVLDDEEKQYVKALQDPNKKHFVRKKRGNGEEELQGKLRLEVLCDAVAKLEDEDFKLKSLKPITQERLKAAVVRWLVFAMLLWAALTSLFTVRRADAKKITAGC